MTDELPTADEFAQLYKAALAFKQQAPWQWMWEDQIWGIRNPETGQIGYASVMGRLGEHLSLAVYHGSQGLNGWYRMANEEEPDNPTSLFEIPHLQASFEDREQLTDKDRKLIKSLGHKFRGRQEWPLFRSYVPGYLPWYVTAAEARFLTLTLQQTVEMAARLQADPSFLDPPEEELFLVRTPGEQGWAEEWLEPELVPFPRARRLDPGSVDHLKEQFPSEIKRIEVDFYGMTGIQNEKGTRPYLGYHFMAVESKSGFILGTDVLVADPSFEEMWARLPDYLLKAMSLVGSLPAEIWVRSDRMAYFLRPVADQLGIRLKVSRRLPALDPALRTFDRMLAR